MTKTHALVIVVIAFLFVSPSAPARTPGPTEMPGPLLVADNPDHKFRPVWAGVVLQHTYKIWNRGKAALAIYDVEASCDCASVQFDREIPAGGAGKITIEINTEGFDGPFEKQFLVMSNDPHANPKTLTISGLAKPAVSVERGNTIMLQGSANQRVSGSARLISNMSKPLRILDVKNSLEGKVAYRLEPVARDKIYEVTVENVCREPTRYNGALTITTNYREQEKITIRILGVIRP